MTTASHAARALDVQDPGALYRRLVDEVFHRRNLAVVDEVLSPGYEVRQRGQVARTGREAQRAYLQGILETFDRIDYVIDDLVVEGGRVCARFHMTAVQRRPWRGLPPAKAPVTMYGWSVNHLENGQFTKAELQVEEPPMTHDSLITRRFVAVNGTELYVDIVGQGVPVIVLHGGLGLDQQAFRPYLDPLGDSAQLVFVDLRGQGRSARIASFDAVDHAAYVADIEALRAALGFEKFVLLGHSYGAHLGLEYAVKHGDRLLGLALVGTMPRFDYFDVVGANAAARATPEQMAVVAGLGQPIPTDAAFAQAWRTIFPMYFHRPNPAVLHEIDARTLYCAGAYNRAFLHDLPKYDVLDRLPTITAPTLLLAGRHDWITPVEQGAQRVHAGIRGSQLVVFEESGHYPFIEEQPKFLETTRAFLRTLR